MDGGIPTEDLKYWQRPLYQLCHSHGPLYNFKPKLQLYLGIVVCFLYGILIYFVIDWFGFDQTSNSAVNSA